jgi:hypothetical protein
VAVSRREFLWLSDRKECFSAAVGETGSHVNKKSSVDTKSELAFHRHQRPPKLRSLKYSHRFSS